MKDSLLLHICCGPCGTVPIRELLKEFDVSSYFYNPNIFPEEELDLRKENARKVADYYGIKFYDEENKYDQYLNVIKGKEQNKNRERCNACYRLRLTKTAEKAKELGINNFSTTLLISPYQDIETIRTIGEGIALKYGVKFYFKDFRPFFKESRKIAKELNLYRQKYCGCGFSLNESTSENH